MHFKMILAVTEVVLIIMSLLTFAYSVYVIYCDAKITSGENAIISHKFLLYTNLVIQLLQFAVAGLLVYKV